MEFTTASPSGQGSQHWPLYVQVLIGMLIGLIGLTNIVSNVCTLLSFATDSKLRTPANLYIANLAATDLIVGLSSLPLYTVYTVLGRYWPFGYELCKVWNVVDYWVCAESSLTIILISQDRLAMVRKGTRYAVTETRRKAVLKIALSWVVAFLLYGPAIIFYDRWRGYSIVEENDCNVEFSSDYWYTLVTSTIEFLVPFLVISTLNVLLYRYIRQRTKLKPGNASQLHAHSEASVVIRRDKKAAKNLILLVLVYFICWLPYVVSTVVITICELCINENVYEFFIWLLWFNSSVNSFLYALANERLRESYRKWLCCFCNVYKRKYGNNTVRIYNDNKTEPSDNVS